jgi:hypothetical protein
MSFWFSSQIQKRTFMIENALQVVTILIQLDQYDKGFGMCLDGSLVVPVSGGLSAGISVDFSLNPDRRDKRAEGLNVATCRVSGVFRFARRLADTGRRLRSGWGGRINQ